MGRISRAALAGVLILMAAGGASAQDRRTFDAKIESWAARQASRKLGELRGPFPLDMTVTNATAHKELSRPPKPPKTHPPLLRPASPPAGPSLPPIVMNRTKSGRADG